MFVEIPAITYLAIWFISQLFSGVLALGLPEDVGGIAWWAHVGGFLAGVMLHWLFVKGRKRFRALSPEAIKKHKGKVTVFVPHYAMSGGTLISLAAREIVMSDFAVLGPVDPQLGKYPAASILKVIAKKPLKDVENETLIMADQAEKAIIQVRESVKELLQGNPTNGNVDELARLLSEGTWTHDFPITYERAKTLGLPVNSNIPDDVLKLMSLYPQPTRTQPIVEYLPVPRTRRPAASLRPRC